MRVTRLSRYVLPAICLAISIPFAYSQQLLQPGIVIQSRIAAEQTQSYAVVLQEDQYIRLVVDQKGIDLGVRVTDPSGRRIGDFDSPSTAGGPETVAFIAESPGTYRLELQPLDEFRNPAPGQYEIRIVELRKATDSELRSGRTQLALRTKGVVLLNEVLTELPAVNNRLMKARYETDVAALMWAFDEKAGAKLLHQAADVLREVLQESGRFNSENSVTPILLRQKIAELMAKHEPEMALEFVRSTRNSKTTRYFGNQDKRLELLIARSLAQSNPRTAYQIAEDHLKDGLPDEILETVEALKEKNPELAAMLIHSILGRLAEQSLIEVPANASMASSLVQLVRRPSAPGAASSTPVRSLISEGELRGLMQKMISEVQSYSPSVTGVFSMQTASAENMLTSLKQWSGGMQVVTPEFLTSIEQRLASKAPSKMVYPGQIDVSEIPFATQEEALNALHRRAFQTAIEERNFESAFQYLEKLSMDENLVLIEEIVAHVGPELKRSTSLSILDRARRFLPSSSRAQDEEELEALLAFVTPYSLLDPNRGFEIVEPLLDQFNDLAAAALTMNGFSETYYQDGEFITNGSNAVAVMANQLSKALGQLTLANFQRAKSDADRIRPTSVRIKIHLAIAARAISGTDDEADEE